MKHQTHHRGAITIAALQSMKDPESASLLLNGDSADLRRKTFPCLQARDAGQADEPFQTKGDAIEVSSASRQGRPGRTWEKLSNFLLIGRRQIQGASGCGGCGGLGGK